MSGANLVQNFFERVEVSFTLFVVFIKIYFIALFFIDLVTLILS